jgi:hypothetical protein
MERAPGLRLLHPDHTGDARLESVQLCGQPARFDLEDKMLVPFSILVLASHLVIAVADDVPKFDIARGRRIDSAAAFDPNAGMNGVATFRRKIDVFGIEVSWLPQNKTRRGERRARVGLD